MSKAQKDLQDMIKDKFVDHMAKKTRVRRRYPSKQRVNLREYRKRLGSINKLFRKYIEEDDLREKLRYIDELEHINDDFIDMYALSPSDIEQIYGDSQDQEKLSLEDFFIKEINNKEKKYYKKISAKYKSYNLRDSSDEDSSQEEGEEILALFNKILAKDDILGNIDKLTKINDDFIYMYALSPSDIEQIYDDSQGQEKLSLEDFFIKEINNKKKKYYKKISAKYKSHNLGESGEEDDDDDDDEEGEEILALFNKILAKDDIFGNIDKLTNINTIYAYLTNLSMKQIRNIVKDFNKTGTESFSQYFTNKIKSSQYANKITINIMNDIVNSTDKNQIINNVYKLGNFNREYKTMINLSKNSINTLYNGYDKNTDTFLDYYKKIMETSPYKQAHVLKSDEEEEGDGDDSYSSSLDIIDMQQLYTTDDEGDEDDSDSVKNKGKIIINAENIIPIIGLKSQVKLKDSDELLGVCYKMPNPNECVVKKSDGSFVRKHINELEIYEKLIKLGKKDDEEKDEEEKDEDEGDEEEEENIRLYRDDNCVKLLENMQWLRPYLLPTENVYGIVFRVVKDTNEHLLHEYAVTNYFVTGKDNVKWLKPTKKMMQLLCSYRVDQNNIFQKYIKNSNIFLLENHNSEILQIIIGYEVNNRISGERTIYEESTDMINTHMEFYICSNKDNYQIVQYRSKMLLNSLTRQQNTLLKQLLITNILLRLNNDFKDNECVSKIIEYIYDSSTTVDSLVSKVSIISSQLQNTLTKSLCIDLMKSLGKNCYSDEVRHLYSLSFEFTGNQLNFMANRDSSSLDESKKEQLSYLKTRLNLDAKKNMHTLILYFHKAICNPENIIENDQEVSENVVENDQDVPVQKKRKIMQDHDIVIRFMQQKEEEERLFREEQGFKKILDRDVDRMLGITHVSSNNRSNTDDEGDFKTPQTHQSRSSNTASNNRSNTDDDDDDDDEDEDDFKIRQSRSSNASDRIRKNRREDFDFLNKKGWGDDTSSEESVKDKKKRTGRFDILDDDSSSSYDNVADVLEEITDNNSRGGGSSEQYFMVPTLDGNGNIVKIEI